MLLNFHKEHYSANLMTVSLAGAYSLDVLQEMALNNFGDIENKNLT